MKTLTVQPNRCEKHHIVPKSLGGVDETWNVANISLEMHEARHVARTLAISGNADTTLRCEQGGNVWRSPAPQRGPR